MHIGKVDTLEMNNQVVIQVENLTKVYGRLKAADGISFEVKRGEIFCMVGPNGAGKTTTIECIEGLRKPTSGSIRVLGLDPQSQSHLLKEKIGVQLQNAVLQPRMKVWEAIDLIGSFYPKTIDFVPLLKEMGLEEKKKAYLSSLSGGQKQRLFIILALIHDPEIVFLDELTTGLDPQARRAMWQMVESIREKGKTIFLITHFMEEAERLADRVAIVDQGRIIALDTPTRLISQFGGEMKIIFTVRDSPPSFSLEGIEGVSRTERVGEKAVVYGRGDSLVGDVVNSLLRGGIKFFDFQTQASNLDDVFLALTGKEMRD